VEFDDSSSRLTWTGTGTIGTGDFTAEAWVKFSDLTADWRTIICQRAGAAAGGDQWVLGVHKTGYLYWYSTALHLTSSAGLITLDQWYHVAVSRSGTNMYLFIDGVLVHSVTNSHNLTYGNIIINANDNGTEAGNCFISNARLTIGEALYTSAFDVPTEPLTATQKLTAVSGTSLLTCQSNRFIDNSSSAHTITVNGNPAISAFNPFGQGSEYAVGENKGSTYFNEF
jgi:hypothetical protein